jgi:hypothetical protein
MVWFVSAIVLVGRCCVILLVLAIARVRTGMLVHVWLSAQHWQDPCFNEACVDVWSSMCVTNCRCLQHPRALATLLRGMSVLCDIFQRTTLGLWLILSHEAPHGSQPRTMRDITVPLLHQHTHMSTFRQALNGFLHSAHPERDGLQQRIKGQQSRKVQ